MAGSRLAFVASVCATPSRSCGANAVARSSDAEVAPGAHTVHLVRRGWLGARCRDRRADPSPRSRLRGVGGVLALPLIAVTTPKENSYALSEDRSFCKR